MDAVGDGAARGACLQCALKAFVCVSLTALLGLHAYSHMMGLPAVADGDLGDAQYVVSQLHRGLCEINEKHEQLASKMERITSTLPDMRLAASRAKDAVDSHQDTIKHALDIFYYDYQAVVIQRPDFALETAGGRVMDTGDTAEYPRYESAPGWLLSGLSALVCHGCDGARHMLRPGSLPGECWAFAGERGEATIRLLGFVIVSGISLEHIPASISPSKEISSAPRSVRLEGLDFVGDADPHDFGTFEYDRQGQPIQYFPVTPHPAAKPYRFVRFRVLTNWGNQEYTCVYRLRVHGDLAPGQAASRNSLKFAEGDRHSVNLK